MAWAALIPVAAQLLGSMGQKEQQPTAQLPPPPTVGELLGANDQAYQPQFDLPYMQPTSLVKVGGNNG